MLLNQLNHLQLNVDKLHNSETCVQVRLNGTRLPDCQTILDELMWLGLVL